MTERQAKTLPVYERAKRFTLTEQDTRALTSAYTGGMSVRAIASDTGRSYGWVHRTLTAAGVQLRERGGPRGTRA